MRFANPWFLLGLLAVPLVVARGVLERRTSGCIVHPLAAVMAAKRGWRTWIPPFSTGLRALIVALLALALARPQDSTERSAVNVEGIDLVLTLDLSGSMATPDMDPTRLGAAKDVVLDFIARRKNDRIGAVVFAENAYTLCPLTLDYTILSQMVAGLELGVIDDKATAIGNAVGLAINRLRDSKAKSRAIILVTDGTSNAGNTSPEQAAGFARLLGIRIYTVLVGQNERSAQVNPALLRDMAEQTKGAFFNAVDRGELASSFHQILDALEKSIIEDHGVTYAEVFGRYLLAALMLALLDLALTLFVVRRIP